MDLLGALSSDQQGPEVPQCSRKGCVAPADWQVKWNNPKIHSPERRKIWLACHEHRPWLESFLQARLFWRSTDPLKHAPGGAEANL
ncbi:acetone carboxylase [Nesterenkonia sphaerica]|uniref:Acetone carboxylase n=1 Tax=Nesterenkonia sphaerica TaxID=1804988 RepID=A0A5R9ALK2_9MICC|nr:acetone carboxylase [Nesterenkonia sphaerica]TLP79473.1 acetone carboxylase [Nesterenkonia sphaerica]